MAAVYVLGRRSTRAVSVLRRLLDLNGIAYIWVDVDEDPLLQLLGSRERLERLRLPAVLFPDGTLVEGPADHHEPVVPPSAHIASDGPYLEWARWRAALVERLGLATRPSSSEYDLLVAGAGPAGLTAAVYGDREEVLDGLGVPHRADHTHARRTPTAPP